MKIRWTDTADRELLAIVAYIYPHNKEAALKLYRVTRSKVLQLTRFPNSGRAGRIDGTRELVIRGTPCLAIYLILDDTVWIAHMLHNAQAWPPRGTDA